MAPAPSQGPVSSKLGEEVAGFLGNLCLLSSLEAIAAREQEWLELGPRLGAAWCQGGSLLPCIIQGSESVAGNDQRSLGKLVSLQAVFEAFDPFSCQGKITPFHQGPEGDDRLLALCLKQLPPPQGASLATGISCRSAVMELWHWRLGRRPEQRLLACTQAGHLPATWRAPAAIRA